MYPPRRKQACLVTFGCQMNVYDSGRLGEMLQSRGWLLTDDPESADFIFFNTCSIREKAAQKVLSRLRQLKGLAARKPELIVGVGGCVAEQEGEKLFDRVPWLNLVVGPQHLPEVPGLLERLEVGSGRLVRQGRGLRPAWSDENLAALGGRPAAQAPAGRSAFVTIMQGCDNYCAYCVVPYLRGPEMSRRPEDITGEVRGLLDRGVLEITLLGQNVNAYGRGLAGGPDFPGLLASLAEDPRLRRLRFTTSHPKDFPDPLIELFGRLPALCEQLHLPVQSGSDRVLSAMGRRYTRAGYLDLVRRLRRSRPGLALSTDVIVGFPGETEADFEETLSLLEEVGYDSLFSFKYSDRPQTRAAGFENKVDEEEKGRRLSLLQARQKTITLEKNRAHLGDTLEVLAEGFGRRPGQLSGRARNLKIVNFDGPAELIGSLVQVSITGAWAASLGGTPACPETR